MARKSRKNSLNRNDWGKALVMAILSPVLVIIQQAADTGNLHTLNWKIVGMAAVGGGVGYLIKNYFTNSKDQLLKKEPE